VDANPVSGSGDGETAEIERRCRDPGRDVDNETIPGAGRERDGVVGTERARAHQDVAAATSDRSTRHVVAAAGPGEGDWCRQERAEHAQTSEN
jgi:hypothetical protein